MCHIRAENTINKEKIHSFRPSNEKNIEILTKSS